MIGHGRRTAGRRQIAQAEAIVDADHGDLADPPAAGFDGSLKQDCGTYVAGQTVRKLHPQESATDERVLRAGQLPVGPIAEAAAERIADEERAGKDCGPHSGAEPDRQVGSAVVS